MSGNALRISLERLLSRASFVEMAAVVPSFQACIVAEILPMPSSIRQLGIIYYSQQSKDDISVKICRSTCSFGKKEEWMMPATDCVCGGQNSSRRAVSLKRQRG